ncbi:MAG: hypothetical protein WD992_01615 [Candidatus Levyibacteriota bacterium]
MGNERPNPNIDTLHRESVFVISNTSGFKEFSYEDRLTELTKRAKPIKFKRNPNAKELLHRLIELDDEQGIDTGVLAESLFPGDEKTAKRIGSILGNLRAKLAADKTGLEIPVLSRETYDGRLHIKVRLALEGEYVFYEEKPVARSATDPELIRAHREEVHQVYSNGNTSESAGRPRQDVKQFILAAPPASGESDIKHANARKRMGELVGEQTCGALEAEMALLMIFTFRTATRNGSINPLKGSNTILESISSLKEEQLAPLWNLMEKEDGGREELNFLLASISIHGLFTRIKSTTGDMLRQTLGTLRKEGVGTDDIIAFTFGFLQVPLPSRLEDRLVQNI